MTMFSAFFAQFTPEQKDTVASGTKLTGAWMSVGVANSADIANWAQATASVAAAILTTLFVLEFLVKKVAIPLYRWWKKRRGEKSCE